LRRVATEKSSGKTPAFSELTKQLKRFTAARGVHSLGEFRLRRLPTKSASKIYPNPKTFFKDKFLAIQCFRASLTRVSGIHTVDALRN